MIGLAPNPQPGGPGFFCRGFPSLSHRVRLFEGAEHSPFATVVQLLATASITRGYENEDVRHMTSLAEPILDGKAFLSIYGESIGDPCKPHRDLIPALSPRNELRKVEEIPALELNKYICEFIISVRTKDGKDYEPSSLRSLLASFERHLKKNSYSASIMNDLVFEETRKSPPVTSRKS